jgi:hypothetical protein
MTTPEPTPTPTWTTLRDASETVGVSTRTIRRAVKDGRIVGQRGDGPADPWMIRLSDAEAIWGTGTAQPAPEPVETTALARALEIMNEARQDAQRLAGDVGRLEAENGHLRERLAELRTTQETEPAPTPKKRWWKR